MGIDSYAGRFQSVAGDALIRWVCINEDKSLSMTATSGFEPANVLCKAADEWVIDELTYSDGIVFVDSFKVQAKQRALARANEIAKYDAFQIQLLRKEQWLRDNAIKIIIGLATGALLAILAKSLFHFGL